MATPNVNTASIPTPNVANPTTPTAVLETAGISFPDNASVLSLSNGAALQYIQSKNALASLIAPIATGGTILTPQTPGTNSISITTDVPGAGPTYIATGKGDSDITITGFGGLGTLAGGGANIVIGKSAQIVNTGGGTGATSLGNTIIGSLAQVIDGFSNNTIVIGTGCSAQHSNGGTLVGSGSSITITAPGVPNTASQPVVMGALNSINVSVNSATVANTASLLAVIGSNCSINGGADNSQVQGEFVVLNSNAAHVSTCTTLIGSSIQDGSMSGVMRVGNALASGVVLSTEVNIDFLPSAANGNPNGSLLLLGSAKQYGETNQAGTASARGNLTGGRGANTGFQFALADQGYTASAPTTGGTVTIPNACSTHVLNPAGTLSTLTVNMPPNPIDGQYLTLTTTQTVTTLTMSGNGNTLTGGLTTITSTTPARWMFCASGGTANAPSNTWVRHD